MSKQDLSRTAAAKRRTAERRTARTAKRQMRMAAPTPTFTRVEVSA